MQLYETRQAIRPGKEQEAENRAQQVYGEKYNLLLMFDSKKAVSRMLDEDAERQNVRRLVRLAHKEQQTFQKAKKCAGTVTHCSRFLKILQVELAKWG